MSYFMQIKAPAIVRHIGSGSTRFPFFKKKKLFTQRVFVSSKIENRKFADWNYLAMKGFNFSRNIPNRWRRVRNGQLSTVSPLSRQVHVPFLWKKNGPIRHVTSKIKKATAIQFPFFHFSKKI